MHFYVVTVFVIFLAGTQYGRDIWSFALKQIGKINLENTLELANVNPIGTEDCRVLYSDQISACEDIAIIGDEAILACGDGPARLQFWPGMGNFNSADREICDEPVYKLDLKTLALTKLKRDGQFDTVLNHGMGEWKYDDGSGRVNLFLINHGAKQSCIDIYKFQSDTMTLLRHVCHPYIKSPNDVAASGTYSFYVTNDHKFRTGYGRYIEDTYGMISLAICCH